MCDLLLYLQKVLTDHDSDRVDSDQDVSATGSPLTRKRAGMQWGH